MSGATGVSWNADVLEALAPYHPLAAGRSGLYRTLAWIFREPPDTELVTQIRGRVFTGAVEDALGHDVAAALRAIPEPGEASLAAASVDFTALFKASTGRFLKPWESVWRNRRIVDGQEQDGLLLGPCATAVAYFYEQAGAERDTLAQPELPDHLSVELDFLGFLAGRESAAFESGRAEEAACDLSLGLQFLDEHVLAWAPEVFAAVQEKAETGVYRAAGLLGARLLETDDRLLDGAREALERPKVGGR